DDVNVFVAGRICANVSECVHRFHDLPRPPIYQLSDSREMSSRPFLQMREAFFEIERLRGLMIFSANNEQIVFAVRRKSNVMIWDGAKQFFLFLGGLGGVPEKRVRDYVAPDAKCDD